MLIFRMETAEGVGMYHNDDSTNIINDGSSNRERWPMPYDDERFKLNKKHHLKEDYDNAMLYGSATLSWENCEDLRNCGLFNFYDEELYRFGFQSFEQLDKWISEFEWKHKLVQANVYLNVYDVPRDFAILGYTQCTFRLDKATLLHSFIATSSEEHVMRVLMNKPTPSESAIAYYKDFHNENS